jgi:hypothetical protein
MNCSICLDDMDNNIYTLQICKHKYHKNCIEDYMIKNDTKMRCPLCRQSINSLVILDNSVDKLLEFIEKHKEICKR